MATELQHLRTRNDPLSPTIEDFLLQKRDIGGLVLESYRDKLEQSLLAGPTQNQRLRELDDAYAELSASIYLLKKLDTLYFKAPATLRRDGAEQHEDRLDSFGKKISNLHDLLQEVLRREAGQEPSHEPFSDIKYLKTAHTVLRLEERLGKFAESTPWPSVGRQDGRQSAIESYCRDELIPFAIGRAAIVHAGIEHIRMSHGAASTQRNHAQHVEALLMRRGPPVAVNDNNDRGRG
jgi:hypothetical protein